MSIAKTKLNKTRKAQSLAAPVLLHSITQLLTMRGDGTPGPRRGSALSDIGLIQDGAVLITGGKIASVGTTRDMRHDSWLKKHRGEVLELDCSGKIVIPGFVDSHTHPVFAKPRLIDFEKRISGATYAEIAEAGGGIRSSIEGVRSESRQQLAERALNAFREMAAYGTTTVEAKSGYGLSHESEIKSLEAIKDAGARWPGTVVPTFLGAHVPPPEYKSNPDQYVDLVCDRMIPDVAKRKLAKYADVFCEKGAFTPGQTERILASAKEHGLGIRVHVCQLTPAELQPILKFRPASLDHMDFVSDDDIAVLAKQETVATLVPGANYFLSTKAYPPARRLIDSGVPVALATDYNPGSSPTASMPMVLSLACTQMKMSPAEALTGATINGAHALGLAQHKGSLEPGKDADLAVFQLEDYREIAYWFGANHCVGTMISGLWAE